MPENRNHPRMLARVLRPALLLLFLGSVVAMGVAWGIALRCDPGTWNLQSAEAALVQGYWSVHRWSGPGALMVESLQDAPARRSWGVEQVIGPPDTQGQGDIPTAWASRSPDGQDEWLTLDFADAVVPSAVHVVETYNPGALVKVSVFHPDGEERVVWRGNDPTPPGVGRGVSVVPINVDFAVRSLKLYFDSAAVPGWNEIDAVALADRQGVLQWATAAQASSTYAMFAGAGGAPHELLPRWSSLKRPADGTAAPATRQSRLAAGFGWPFLAMQGERDTSAVRSGPAGPVPPGGFRVAFARTIPSPPLPYRPIWTGLLADAALYGFALWAIYLFLSRPLRIFRELMRLRHGHCLRCGYDLRYDFMNGCPECGWRREHAESPATKTGRPSNADV